MADQLQPPVTYPLVTQPGIKRDGTTLDGYNYQDGQWVRFQRGRPKKMGGYRAMTKLATGPFRSMLVDSRNGVSSVHSFSPWGVERLQFDINAGAVGAIANRTPPGGGGSGATLGTVVLAAGAVASVPVTSGGQYYTTAPLVFFAGGGGTGATGHTTISGGQVTGVVIDTGGSGYTSPPTAILVGFAHDESLTWQHDVMFANSGGGYSALIASSTPDLLDIANDANGYVWSGDITSNAALQPLLDKDGETPIQVSGGCCVLQPFLVVYGSNGLIRNSDANQISGAAGWQVGGGGFASSANVAGTKIVKGTPVRGGSAAPAGLFWSLDSLVRMTFVGGTQFWNYDTVDDDISILAKNSVIEYDGIYYWLGVDRFFAYSGVVQEIPNQLNMNWFFDNLNYAYRNKIFAVKVPRYGEIHWYFPFGSSTECNACLIYNVREQTWYDNSIARSAGHAAKVFPHPVMGGTEDQLSTTLVGYTPGVGNFSGGEQVTGLTSGAQATIYRVGSGTLNFSNVSGTFVAGETFQASDGDTGVVSFINTTPQLVAPVWQHEIGHDKIIGQQFTAIPSWFQTNSFGFPAGGPMEATRTQVPWMQQPGNSVGTRVVWLEPDAIQIGDMTVDVIGGSYANSKKTTTTYTISEGQEKVDMKAQYRELSFKFTSNVIGGHYEIGSVIVAMSPGDIRG